MQPPSAIAVVYPLLFVVCVVFTGFLALGDLAILINGLLHGSAISVFFGLVGLLICYAYGSMFVHLAYISRRARKRGALLETRD